ncbi:capreomycidine synthase [Kitasatospora aureofaciens]|uniref:capreomycidine synthase n=1 Tax=Kitasatospora aureofaciens TaxID=1894 RepID=UPI000527F45C|nr:capreomycidine synthase [Kitasatospora aureofaciens]
MRSLVERALLEDFLRERYHEADIDISSSGVEPYTMAELRDLLGFDLEQLAAVSLRDSQSAGGDELRELIAARYGLGDAGRVLVGNGSTEAQLLCLAALLEPGDEVVVVEPAYHSLLAPVRARGCRIRRWRLRPEDGFRPNLEELRQLVTSATKAVIVNFPHNPTGVTLTAGELAEFVTIVERRGCYLLWDGAFEDLVFDAPPLAAPTHYERALCFGTMSKAFGLPGLRVGWGIVPPELVHAAVGVRDYTTLALSPLVEWVAQRALEGAERLIGPHMLTAAANRRLVHGWLSTRPGEVPFPAGGAGVVVFPQLTRVPNTMALCERLMREYRVLLVPGECFGVPGRVRLGFGGTAADLAAGLDALSHLLDTMAEEAA